MPKKRVVIIGAGLSGLSAAYHKGCDCSVFEKEREVGGLCRSSTVGGFTFDRAGHLLHFKDKNNLRLVEKFLSGNLRKIKRSSWVNHRDSLIPYPFQAHVANLPSDVAEECISGLGKTNGASSSASFKDWIINNFGSGMAKHFFFPYNEKFWTIPLERINCEWLDGFIPKLKICDVLSGNGANKNLGYNSVFFYPKRGGISSLTKAVAANVKKLHLNHEAIKIDRHKRQVYFKNGHKEKYDKLISTIALPELPRLMPDLPLDIRSAIKKLKYTSVLNINLGVDNGCIKDQHWIYFPDKNLSFYRVGFFHNFSKLVAPKGRSSLYVELAYSKDKPLNKKGIVSRVAKDLIKAKIIKHKKDIVAQEINDIKYGYIIYDQNRKKSLKKIHNFLNKNDITSIGRYGSWRYLSMEDCIKEAYV